VLLELVVAVARGEVDQRRLGDVAGRELSAQIAEHLDRHPHIGLDQREQGLVALAPLVKLQRWDAQAFLVYLGRIRGVRAGHPAANIGVMAYGAGPGDRGLVTKDRLEYENIRQKHAT